MSINGLKPTFTNREGYLAWRKTWKEVYRDISEEIRRRKVATKAAQRASVPQPDASEKPNWKAGEGCHVCGESHGSAHYFEHCGPRHRLRTAYLRGKLDSPAPELQKHLAYLRSDARKMMTILEEAKLRRDRIVKMQQDIANQPFPLTMEANVVDVHYNRGHNEFDFLPRWVVKCRGQSFYVDHIDADVPWSTRELDSGSTRGMLRFRKCELHISKDSCASLKQAA